MNKRKNIENSNEFSIDGNIIPNDTNAYTIGNPTLQFANIYTENATFENGNFTNFTATDITTTNLTTSTLNAPSGNSIDLNSELNSAVQLNCSCNNETTCLNLVRPNNTSNTSWINFGVEGVADPYWQMTYGGTSDEPIATVFTLNCPGGNTYNNFQFFPTYGSMSQQLFTLGGLANTGTLTSTGGITLPNNSGAPSTALTDYAEYSTTLVWGGSPGPIDATDAKCSVIRIGHLVTISSSGFSAVGNGNADALISTTLPTWTNPAAKVDGLIINVEDASANAMGILSIATNSVLSVMPYNSLTFGGSTGQTYGIPYGFTITYSVLAL